MELWFLRTKVLWYKSSIILQKFPNQGTREFEIAIGGLGMVTGHFQPKAGVRRSIKLANFLGVV